MLSPFPTATVLAYRVWRRAQRDARATQEKILNRLRPTFPSAEAWNARPLHRRFSFLTFPHVQALADQFPRLQDLVLQQSGNVAAHRFDLLGSGPCHVYHGMTCRGMEGQSYDMSRSITRDRQGHWLKNRINRTNLRESQRIWAMVDEDYTPIDWQLDFKSGYRWRESTWHRDIAFAHLPGVDIKVPWELARMQHLPTLGLACHFARRDDFTGFGRPDIYANEFRNQVLDFIATNPPGFGVNWTCAMDVAIRATNLLVAHDIVTASGATRDDAFEAVFTASIQAHARHVFTNLEWSPRYRGNHYLANIVGLLFMAAYLPGSKEVDDWLAFAAKELLVEVAYQFHEDGSNFEASICYHRLSAEMVMWAFALLSQLPKDKLAALAQLKQSSARALPVDDRGSPVPPWCWSRLVQMADFTQAMTRPDNLVVQFGDNDSGRFIILGSGEQMRANNDPRAMPWSLDHGSLVAGIHALAGVASAPSVVEDDPSAHLVRAFAGGGNAGRTAIPPPSITKAQGVNIGKDGVWADHIERFERSAAHGRWVTRFSAVSKGLLDGLTYQAFTGMGCFIFRSPRLYLAVRCGEIGIAGLGAHAHCDQLGIELVIDGMDHARDPGTYIYTPSLDKRNAYRSASAHHVPRVPGREPADLALGPFDLRGAAVGECLYLGPRGFVGRHAGYGPWVYRIVAVEDDGVSVFDFAEGDLSLTDPTPTCLPFSSGYGHPVSQASVSS